MNKKGEMAQLLFIIESATKSLAKLIAEEGTENERKRKDERGAWADFCRAQERLKEERQ